MNKTINFVYYRNSERQDWTLDKIYSLSLVRPYKVSRSRLKCIDIGQRRLAEGSDNHRMPGNITLAFG